MDHETRQAFDMVLKTLESLQADVGDVKDGQARLEVRMGAVEFQVGALESKMNALQERQAETTRAIRALDAYTKQGFDTLIGMVESLDARKVDRLAQS